MLNPLDLSGKLILVTGASSGIGRATAAVLSQLGADLILSGRREAELKITAEMLKGEGHVQTEPFDLGDIDAIPLWIKRICEGHDHGFHGIVHSAGLGVTIPVRILNRRKLDDVMTINVYAALGLLRGVATNRSASPDGCSVVLFSSVAGLVGAPGKTAYGGSKAALQLIAKSAALELAEKQIRVNCIAPGWVDTPMLRQAMEELPGGLPDLKTRQVLGLIAPEEIGTAAAYLLSDATRHMTGTTLVLDGGYTC
jgi:NAD(P)-dependent dehydrogenase (short-subunit alcohol dehydrogenase family)